MLCSGPFQVKMTHQDAENASGVSFGHHHFEKSFEGSLSGTSTVEMLSARPEDSAAGGYVAIERFSVTLDGREGTFVALHLGLRETGHQSLTIDVVPESGTKALRGLRGKLAIRIEDGQHYYDFDYTLPE